MNPSGEKLTPDPPAAAAAETGGNGLSKAAAAGKIAGYFLLLLTALVLVYSPALENPPRSDWWSALYAFHLVDASPGPPGFSFIVNHDPWRDGTFRPLAHPVLYLEHRLFGASFISYHLVNLAAYFASIVLLYLLGRNLGISRGVLAVFLALFSLLYSHFDIVTWTFHVTVPISFSAFLGGMLLYLRYLREGKKPLLAAVGALFLLALLSLELYIFWPLSVLLIPTGGRTGRRLPAVWMIGAVYSVYLLVFFLTRSAAHTSGSLSPPGGGDVFLSLSGIFFNLLYNGVLVNLAPFLALPPRISHNVRMGGPVAGWSVELMRLVVGAVGTVSMLLTAVALAARKFRRRLPPGLGLLGFLYASGFFILVLGRSTTKNFPSLFFEFRYQYIPNAWLVLAAALLVDRMIGSRKVKGALVSILLLATVLNFFAVRSAVLTVSDELYPLKTFLGRISRGIETGEITPQRPLAIPDWIPRYLPPLSWNEDMGRFFRGTYQWIYSREEIYCFTPFIGDAAWVADGGKLDYRPRRRGDPPVLPGRDIPGEFIGRAGSLQREDLEWH